MDWAFFSKCVSSLTNKQTKKLKTKEFEEKKKGLSFGFREKKKGKTVRRQEKIEDLEKDQ